MATPRELVDALASTVDATSALCAGLTDEQWAQPTGCPGWSVHDSVSHLVGLEAVLAGAPDPDHDLVGEFPHVTGPMGEYMERQVDYRRTTPSIDVLAEFDAVFGERIAYLRSLDDTAFDAPAGGPLASETTLKRMLQIRIFDCWAHEQDIRRAVGAPGGLDTAAAEIALGVCKRNAPHVVASALPDGSSIVFRLTGPYGGDVAAEVADGKPTRLDAVPTDPTVIVATDTETFAYLCCGRSDGRPGEVKLEGDRELGDAVLNKLGFTP